MSNVVNDFTLQGYNINLQYSKFDVVYGVTALDTNFYYATQDNFGASPVASVSYSGIAWQRADDLATVFFTKTGSQPDFVPGTVIAVNSVSTTQASLSWTGLAIDGGNNYVTYMNPGWNQPNTSASNFATVTAIYNPAWTTGFFWVPSNTTDVAFTTKRDFAQFGDGYTQQARMGINSIGSVINMVFESRSYREAKSLLNFVQVAGGVQPVTINMPVTTLFNNPQTRYLLTDPKVSMSSYNLNTITVTATRVYNF